MTVNVQPHLISEDHSTLQPITRAIRSDAFFVITDEGKRLLCQDHVDDVSTRQKLRYTHDILLVPADRPMSAHNEPFTSQLDVHCGAHRHDSVDDHAIG